MIVRSLLTALGFDVDSQKVRKYDQALAGVVTVSRLAVAATIALGTAFLKTAGDMEQTQIAFETMLGSAEKADQLIRDITDFAAKTPFELKGLVDNSKKLLAFGIASEDIIDTMTNLGNVAAGVGRDKLPNIVLAFGKIRTKGKASMEELNILLEAGVPILDTLADHFGIARDNMGELFKMVSKGKVGFEDVNKALTSLSTGSGQFAGLMEKQSKSFLGIISNIGDFITQFANSVGQELLPMAKELAKAFLKFLEVNQEIIKGGIIKGFMGIVRAIAFVFIFIKKLIKIIAPMVKNFIATFEVSDELKESFKAVGDAILNVVKHGIRLTKFVAGLLAKIIKTANEMGVFSSILKAVSSALKVAGSWIKFIVDILEFLSPIFDPIIRLLLFVGKLWLDIFSAIANKQSEFIDGIVPVIKAFVDKVVELWNSFSSSIVEVWDTVIENGTKAWGDFIVWLSSLWEGFNSGLTAIWDGIVETIKSAVKAISDFVDPLANILEKILGPIDEKLSAVFGIEPSINRGPEELAAGAVGAGGGGQTVSTNINSNVTIGVPAGTPEEQKIALQSTAKTAVRAEWGAVLRELQVNNAPVDQVIAR